jgi:hypothetical protein
LTAGPPESLDRQGVPTLEVRRIFPGELAAAVVGWFGRFPAETKVLEDAYLLDPQLPGLSVKVREGRALEVKAYRGSPEPPTIAPPRARTGQTRMSTSSSFPLVLRSVS